MAAHNVDLLNNTNADQIIFVECGAHSSGLPPITYIAGELKDELVRKGGL